MVSLSILDNYLLLLALSFLIPLTITLIGWGIKSSVPLRVLLGIGGFFAITSFLVILITWLGGRNLSVTGFVWIVFLIILLLYTLRPSPTVVVRDHRDKWDNSSFSPWVFIVFAVILYFVFSKSVDVQTKKIEPLNPVTEATPIRKINYFEILMPMSMFCLLLVLFTWAMLHLYERYLTKSVELALREGSRNLQKTEVISRVKNGKIEEAVDELSLMAKQVGNKDMLDSCALLMSKLNLLKLEHNRGIIDPEEYRRQLLRIGESVINNVNSMN